MYPARSPPLRSVSADGNAGFSIGVLAALAVIAPLIDEPNIEKAQSPAMNPALSFFNIFDFLNIKCISPFHFCKEKEPDFGSFFYIIYHNAPLLSNRCSEISRYL